MKKRMIYSILLVLVVMAGACESWLDVQPRTKIKSDDLFETEAGFKDALVGVYTLMKAESLYGRELTFGFLEAATGCYGYNGSAYYQLATGNPNWNYTSTVYRPIVDNMWTKMYNALANVNNLLDNIDNHQGVFTGDNYSIIKGEALGLRAYLHFDLLRLFSSATDLEKEAIPYVKSLQIEVPQVYSGKEVLVLLNEDIEEALACLEKDPIREGNMDGFTEGDFLNKRQMHFNYFAVKALQARVALWGGDLKTAKAAANDVVTVAEEVFPWVDPDNASSNTLSQRDYAYASEHIFALNVRNLKDLVEYWFMPDGNSNQLYMQTGTFNQYYEVGQGNNVGGVDYRQLYQRADRTGGNYQLRKFYQPDSYSADYAERMPLIRLAEMYYILAECWMGEDDTKALGYLNEVRRHRGITADLADANTLANELTKEYCKELLLEGQIFYYCKRMNMDKFPYYYKNFANNKEAVYVLPLPELEKEFGDYYTVENE